MLNARRKRCSQPANTKIVQNSVHDSGPTHNEKSKLRFGVTPIKFAAEHVYPVVHQARAVLKNVTPNS